MRKNKHGRKAPTPQQRRQRELAWMVYIAEGCIANIHKAIAVNCVTFDDADKRAVNKAAEQLIMASETLRKRMQQIT